VSSLNILVENRLRQQRTQHLLITAATRFRTQPFDELIGCVMLVAECW